MGRARRARQAFPPGVLGGGGGAGCTAFYQKLGPEKVREISPKGITYTMKESILKNLRELSSHIGVLGIVKKVGYLLAVAVAIVADWVAQTAAV